MDEYELQSEEERTDPSLGKFKRTEYFVLYPRRFLVLLILALALLVNGEVWMTFGSVERQSMSFFSANDRQIVLFSNLFLAAYAVAAVPCVVLPQLIGARNTLLIGCGLNLTGCILRLALLPISADNHFRLAIALIGNVCFGGAMAFLFALPTLISSIWFGDRERSLSTAVPLMANCFGVGSGYIAVFLLMAQTNNAGAIQRAFTCVFAYEFGLSVLCLALCLIFVEQMPPSPPSCSEKERAKNARTGSVRTLVSSTLRLTMASFKKDGAIAALVAYTLNYSVYVVVFTYLTAIVDNFIRNQSSVTGYIGAAGILAGGFNTLLAGWIMERTHNEHNGAIGLISNAIPILPLSILLGLCVTDKLTSLGSIVLFVWFLTFAPIYMSIGAEILAEVTYPVDPNISSSAALIFGNCFGAIMSSLISLIPGDAKYFTVLGLSIFLYLVNVLLLNRKFARTRSNPL